MVMKFLIGIFIGVVVFEIGYALVCAFDFFLEMWRNGLGSLVILAIALIACGVLGAILL
ncbi:hypothetical protein IX317_000616 [Fusobacterium sp. DD29]|uniref:hypothetical protein n=1 Tax=unclassified Fusobacterium TaxID=2648384 RepID=UPI001B8D6470|nr:MULTISPECIES: hypothetical protein [unclassified Fusobacterium]MBR8700262.1 hypothetical protein [Fusobacterium sp. DD45]MBR8710483.1 hypothetical protein [Fusobacterium sp. DD28]MBR8748955.1 hypothetical protein [Fusobacterium sp. DD29]MBR8751067.1 hypothetical protein [Fusobacterium sp. DD26]MBR8761261.1 hypothetical protein [Fusobacterium sp. DD25]